MNRKRLVLILTLPLVLVIAAATIVFLLPAERVAGIAARHAESALGREVRIDRVSIDLFPAPGVALEGVAIAGASSDAPPLATVRRAVLRIKLLPLFARRVVVDAVTLDSPRMLVVVDTSGALNIPTFGGTKADTAAEESAAAQQAEADAAGAGIAFLVDRFEIRDGRFGYRDERTGTAIRIDGLDQRLHLAGELSGGTLARIRAEGELDIDALGAVLPEGLAVPIENARLRIEHDALLDRTADSLALPRLTVRIQEIALDGAGVVRELTNTERRDVALRLAAGPVDVGALVRSLPRALIDRMAPEGVEIPDVDGTATLEVAARGALGVDALPEVDGTLTLDAFRLAWGKKGDLIDRLGGRIRFSLDSVATDGIEGRLLGQPLNVAFAVRDFAAPNASARVRAGLDLQRATALGLIPDSLGAAGTVGVDLAVRAPLLQPERGAIDGAVSLAGVSAQPPTILVPVRVESGRIAFRGQKFATESLRLRMDESDVAIDLEVDRWLPFALGDSTAVPTVHADIRSQRLDLDPILGPPPEDVPTYAEILFARLADRPIDGRPAEEVAAEAGFVLPPLPPVALDGRFRANTFRRNDLELQNLDVAFSGNGERIEVTDARFGIMGGAVQLAGRVGLPTGADDSGMPAVFSYQLRDVGAAAFLNRFTPFRNHLSGSLLLGGTVRMVLDRNLLPLRESVVAEGSIAVSGGQLVNWPVVKALGQKLELARFDTLSLRDWAGQFRITGPTVTIAESLLDSDELTARAAGAFDFAGRLDLTATLLLEPTLTGRIRGELGPRLAALAGPDGRVPLGITINGPAREPSLGLDFSEARDQAVARARQEAEERARQLAEEAARNVAGKFIPGADSAAVDSLRTAPVDSARAKVEAEVRNRLRQIIRIKN